MRADDNRLPRFRVLGRIYNAHAFAAKLLHKLRVMDDRPERADGFVLVKQFVNGLHRAVHTKAESRCFRHADHTSFHLFSIISRPSSRSFCTSAKILRETRR